MNSNCKKCAPKECIGPCHDFCPCGHCWNGWTRLSFWLRLKERLKYLVLGDKLYYSETFRAKTWWYEALFQAALYLTVIYVQFGTLWRQELVLAAGLWWLGRAASRASRQAEKYERIGFSTYLVQYAVECASGMKWDLRFATVAFGIWGLMICSWLTLADVAWTLCYPIWRYYRSNRS